ncbi:Mrr restriction system protein [Candidatus Entotheonellaceae bacterium PAL068K]
METPKDYEFMNPILQALREGGGTLTNAEIFDAVVNLMQLPEDVLERKYQGKKKDLSEVEYRIGWAKTYLKRAAYLMQSKRGVWGLTSKGRETDRVDERAVKKEYNARHKEKDVHQATQGVQEEEDEAASAAEEIEEELGWKQKVLETILAIAPDAFERLCQRLLRECGFTQVEITGRSSDGGLDGKGVLRLGGLINFQVVFQSKRYAGTVSANIVRDFRGAMIGRADKGLIISTGTFSRDARAEAIRDGASAIDLVDGQELVELLKKYEIGVKTVMVEKVEVDVEWLSTI